MKPVRDTVQHALQYWKSLPGSDTPEPSETGSSIKGFVSMLINLKALIEWCVKMDVLKSRLSLLIKCSIMFAFANLNA